MTTTTIDSYTDTCQYIGTELGYTRLQPTCCAPSIAGKSYCAEHVWQVYQEGSATARRKKDLRVAAAVWDLESEFNAAIEELVNEGFDI
jgi:hypothetical protein